MIKDYLPGGVPLGSLKLCLFFTYGVSLKTWDESGIFESEVLLYKELLKLGVEVSFFTYGDESDLNYTGQLSGIKIIPAYTSLNKKKNSKLRFLNSFFLAFKFKKEFSRYDILKTNQMWGAWVPLVAKWLTGKKLIVRCGFEHYYTLLKEKWPILERNFFYLFSLLAYHYSDLIVVSTAKIAEFVSKSFFIKPEKIRLQPSLIDIQLFGSKDKPVESTDRIIFVGRLSREKNLVSLIQASKESGVGLDMVGAGSLKDELREAAGKISLDARFFDTLPNKEIPRFLSNYEIFVLPSLYEGNPKALLEAMSCGKAVIGTDIEGIRGIIKDGENGILCGTSAGEISKAILKLKKDPELRKKIQNGARKFIEENLNMNKIVEGELKLYEEVNKKVVI